MTREMRIGRLAEVTGTTPATIRYYEEIGLLPRTQRGWGGQRVYHEDDANRLIFIRRCREFGLSVEEVGRLAVLVGARDLPCRTALDLAKNHLGEMRRKLAELIELEREIAGMVRKCDDSCSTGPAKDCLMLAQLSRPRVHSDLPEVRACCAENKR